MFSSSTLSFVCSALVMLLTVPGANASKSASAAARNAPPSAVAVVAEGRRAELRSAGQAAIHAFANALASMAQSGSSSEIKGKAILAIKQVMLMCCCGGDGMCALLRASLHSLGSSGANTFIYAT